MRMSSMVMCKQTTIQPNLLHIPPPPPNIQVLRSHSQPPQKEKVVVILGATGTGKSRLSIDLATRFPSEIVNSDKIQVYSGLDITTNKITEQEQSQVPHHLLGTVDLNINADFSATQFCNAASLAVRSITGRGQLPIIVGGSNSYVEALVENELRSNYELCFLWVDVSLPLLHSFVSERVDRMVRAGMVEEVRDLFDRNAAVADYSRGIRRAIGVPEFDRYFRAEAFSDRERRLHLLREAISEIKSNTRKLACRQLEKIYRLRNVKGWKLHRLDPTDVFLKHGEEADQAWEMLVAGPSAVIVSRFLYSLGPEEKRYGNVAARRWEHPWQLQVSSR